MYAFSKAKCYFPDCPEFVVKFIGDDAFTNVDRAHIHGAKPGSARYDPNMTDEQRRAFANLVLLCRPHHVLVDQRRPDDYPAETLLEWKTQREADAGVDQSVLSSVTDDDLLALIERVVAAVGPLRAAKVELGVGFAGSTTLILPEDKIKDFIDFDGYKDIGPKVLVLTIRNTGSLPIYWASEKVTFAPCGAALSARNDFPHLNPSMPLRIESGDSAHWFYDLSLITKMTAFFRQRGAQVDELVAKVSLGSGEELESDPLSAQYLPDWSN